MAKELYYGGRKPKSYLPARNQVLHTPEFAHGTNGSRRFWIPPQWVGRGWSKCPCGWRGNDPKWQTHYAHSAHVKNWKERIKKHGSLEAAHKAVHRELFRHFKLKVERPF